MGDWVKAAESQLEQYRWQTSERGTHWMRVWAERVSQGEPHKRDMYSLLLRAEQHKLLTAEAIWVSPEMCEVTQMAAEGFEPEPLLAQDFITMTGFCYFDTPLYMLDRNKMVVSVGAISWCPYLDERTEGDEPGGMAIALYSSAYAEKDEFSKTLQVYMSEAGTPSLLPLHLSIIQFGDSISEGDLYDPDGNYTGADEWWRTVQVALRLMQQRISDHYEQRLPRPDRRRLQRAGSQIEDVLVIRLRRPTVHQHQEESETVEWSHRWLVDGHWRWQPYGDGIRRQIWISPFVKGPGDKPLVVKRRLYKWDR
jgi:hypothetical protein